MDEGDGLFDDAEFEVPIVRAPRARKGAAAGSRLDARFANDYPPDWDRCTTCGGRGKVEAALPDPLPPGGVKLWIDGAYRVDCPDCLGMGSLKARVRLEAGHRCVRCQHPYVPKGDAEMLGVEPSGRWVETDGERVFVSSCDAECSHLGPYLIDGESAAREMHYYPGNLLRHFGSVEAFWRILTVHHLDGDKSNVRWWNLVALCQRCHLEIQAKVVMERVYPHEHSGWFKPYAAGYYAFVYLCKVCGRRLDFAPGRGSYLPDVLTAGYPHECSPGLEITREQTLANLDRLLALELVLP